MSVPRLRSSQRWDVGLHRLLVSEDGLFFKRIGLNPTGPAPTRVQPVVVHASPPAASEKVGIPAPNRTPASLRKLASFLRTRRRSKVRLVKTTFQVDDSVRSFSQTTQWAL